LTRRRFDPVAVDQHPARRPDEMRDSFIDLNRCQCHRLTSFLRESSRGGNAGLLPSRRVTNRAFIQTSTRSAASQHASLVADGDT
jgi:hypothetical protein